MTLTPDEITAGVRDELAAFGALLRSASAQEWETTTRCEGWRVADVAAHVVGTVAYVTEGRTAELADPSHVERQVAERHGRTPGELADELERGAKVAADMVATFEGDMWQQEVPGLEMSLAEGVEAIWYDAFVHGDDIRAALGRPSERGGGLRASVHHVAAVLTRQGWGPATLSLDGVEALPVGEGSGATVTGDALEFVLAATGRLDPSALGLDETINIYR